jgi:hypothetical protein
MINPDNETLNIICPIRVKVLNGMISLLIRLYKDHVDPMNPLIDSIIIKDNDGQRLPIFSTFTLYNCSNGYGSVGLGYDMYACYIAVEQILIDKHDYNFYVYNIGRINYFSINAKYILPNKKIIKIILNESDCKFVNQSDIYRPNPWLINNNDTNCYIFKTSPSVIPLPQTPCPSPSTSTQKIIISNNNFFPNNFYVNKDTNQIGVYRLDRETSQIVTGDESEKGKCLDTYLVSTLGPYVYPPTGEVYYQYGILRVPLFKVYISEEECQKYKKYNCQYFSIGSHQVSMENIVPFWTVNSRQLKSLKNKDGYAYIFWAPYNDVKSLSISDIEPPIIQWGSIQGYLLQTPTFAFIFRYRGVDKSWVGSPDNCICYPIFKLNKPITTQLIFNGINYCPELYGDNFSSFQKFMNSDHIGAVQKNSPWPDSSIM